jgi:hypothetical protein
MDHRAKRKRALSKILGIATKVKRFERNKKEFERV